MHTFLLGLRGTDSSDFEQTEGCHWKLVAVLFLIGLLFYLVEHPGVVLLLKKVLRLCSFPFKDRVCGVLVGGSAEFEFLPGRCKEPHECSMRPQCGE